MSLLRMYILFATTTCRRPRVGIWSCSRNSSEVDNRERLEGIFGNRIFELFLVSGPGSTLKIETMDADTFRRDLELLLNTTIFSANDFFLDLSLCFNRVQRPFLLCVLSSDFLHCSSEETLWIIEACEPERNRSGTLD